MAFNVNGADNLMSRARALVGHFSSISQASEALANVQRRGPNTKSLVVMQDVKTRWWSTWKMIQRLKILKNYFSILVDDGVLDPNKNLTQSEWNVLSEIEEILEPFMSIQRLLEGQKYVTISLVTYLINTVRNRLKKMSTDAVSGVVRSLCHEMLEHPVNGMHVYWGRGDVNTLFDENNETGRGQRQKGFPHNTLLAAALDPRTKSLRGIGQEDKNKIWDAIRCRMRVVHEASLPTPNENAESASNTSTVDDEEVISRRDPMVELLQGIGGESDDEYGQEENPRRDVVDTIIDIELQHYRSMKILDIILVGKTEAGEENFSNPLLWWKIHRGVLPLLSTLARRTLCIPATSAPSERVFSTAGLTIAKCRASIQPQHASELIFLHDSWPFAEESEKHRRQKNK